MRFLGVPLSQSRSASVTSNIVTSRYIHASCSGPSGAETGSVYCAVRQGGKGFEKRQSRGGKGFEKLSRKGSLGFENRHIEPCHSWFPWGWQRYANRATHARAVPVA